jgi:hypothetical protein
VSAAEVREVLLRAASLRQTCCVRFARGGVSGIAVGRPVVVDDRVVSLLVGRSADTYRLPIDLIAAVEVVTEPKGEQQ